MLLKFCGTILLDMLKILVQGGIHEVPVCLLIGILYELLFHCEKLRECIATVKMTVIIKSNSVIG